MFGEVRMRESARQDVDGGGCVRGERGKKKQEGIVRQNQIPLAGMVASGSVSVSVARRRNKGGAVACGWEE